MFYGTVEVKLQSYDNYYCVCQIIIYMCIYIEYIMVYIKHPAFLMSVPACEAHVAAFSCLTVTALP